MSLELIVSPFLDVIFDKLTSLISNEFHLLRGVNRDLQRLSETVSTIKTVLIDAEVKQINHQPTRVWLRKLKDAAYEAEDILEDCELEALQQESEIGAKNCESLSACFDFKQIIFRRKMGKRIKEVLELFEEIDAQRSKFQLSPGVVVLTGVEGGGDRETSSILGEPFVCGRDEEVENVVEILLHNVSSSNDLSICPILGIGGLGKTTLAQLVYGDDRIVKEFDIRIWICVSEDFSVKRITRMMIDHLSEKKCDLVDLDPMQKRLRNLLYGKRYLLVLDDIWDDVQDKWNKLIDLLAACGGKGSSVIVTTRLQTVVNSIAGFETSKNYIQCVINPTCHLKFLLERDCWSHFEHYAFGIGDKENQSLIEIGKDVVKKCKGVPLAIKAVGSLLKSRREEFWNLARDSEIWDLEEQGENVILPALRLSYNHLPPHFRQCFAYCSVYPKDSVMIKETLIHEWMANGFIQSSRGMDVEDVGNEIFNGLLQRSFFQDINEDKTTRVVQCQMHDLVHDLACSVTKNECSRMKVSEMGGVSQRLRHVSMTCDSPHLSNTFKAISVSQPFLRSIIFLVGNDTNFSGLDLFLSCISRFKHLRVLDLGNLWSIKSLPPSVGHLKQLRYLNLENTGIPSLPIFVCGLTNLQALSLSKNERLTTLPSSVGNLKNLRFLDLSLTDIQIFPETICTLTNLQTLRLMYCRKLEALPRGIRNMRSLRNLTISWERNGKLLINSMPVGIGQLTRLEVLDLFMVSSNSEGAAGIQELGGLNQLRGKLRIKDIGHVLEPRDAQEANLKSKSNLSALRLYWGSNGGENNDVLSQKEKKENMIRSKKVLGALHPHPNLQELVIRDYPGVEFPAWVEKCAVTLSKLNKLFLFNMPNAVHDLRQLPPCLEALWIVRCPKLRLLTTTALPLSIKELAVDASNDPTLSFVEALPRLPTLQIGGFHEQETLPRAPLQKLTRVRTLYVVHCSKLKRLPTEFENLGTTLKKLEITDCRELDYITDEGLRNLTSLEELKIQNCGSLKSLAESSSSMHHLISLKVLKVYTCPILEITISDFQNLVALERLVLRELPQLTSFPEGIQFSSTLQNLVIRDCKNLRMLPEWMHEGLPPLLSYLQITECHPELHTRCKKDNGEDWHKISHLQFINLE
ncbi:hypothetical protein ACHQM5_014674 [Ranunculus cassubicifolius]